MATITLTQASAGAPTLNGVNGSLCAVLDWALVQNGWSIEYTATNKRIYRAGSGNRRRLFVAHDSALSGNAALAVTRGCENATAANEANLTDPFPTVAQVGNTLCTVAVSNAAGATARDYVIVVSPTHFVMSISTQGFNYTGWDTTAFGDLDGVEAGDTWATFIMVGNNSSPATTSRALSNCANAGFSGSAGGRLYFCRNIDGSIKSTYGSMDHPATSGSVGSVSSAPAARAGYGNRVVRQRAAINCTGQASSTAGVLCVYRRGWVPNFWMPLHTGYGSLTTDDTFGDTAYNASATFRPIIATTNNFYILETSDTWALP